MSKITKLRQGLGVAALLAVLATPTVQAMPGGGMMGGGGFGFRPNEAQRELMKEVQAVLKLSDSQKSSIKEITAEFNKTSGEIRREAGLGFGGGGFGKGKQPDPEKAAEANKKIEKLRTETWAKIEEALDTIDVLTQDDTGKPSVNLHDEQAPPSVSEARIDEFAAALWAVYDLHRIWRSLGPRVQPLRQQATPGRNDPCWCGSGQKFKKCHGA